jgi:hypothetical protein
VESIQQDVVWEVQYNLALLEQLSAGATSEILASNQVAPNITLDNFEIMGGYADGLGGIMTAIFIPFVAASKREEWEEYSVSHQAWIEESDRLMDVHAKHLQPLKGTAQDHETDKHDGERKEDEIEDIPNKIWKWNDAGEKTVLGPLPDDHHFLAPLWQSSPAEPSTVNVDMFSDSRFTKLYHTMRETKQAVMGSATAIGPLFEWIYTQDDRDHNLDPHAFLMEAVFANFSHANEVVEPIGVIMAVTSYKHLFERILPEGANGIYVVLTGNSACGANVTFLLNGPEAAFVGYHDFHQGLDQYEEVIPLELYDTVTENLCTHDLHIYPSPVFKDIHNTNKAM